jgi:glycosyltransferase involved in cell wall biosynthesis
MKVLHVTEALATGVMDMLATYSLRQTEQGAHVHILFTSRPDTPGDEELAQVFDSRVQLSRVSAPGDSKLKSLLLVRTALRREVRENVYDAIHLHSSFAGALGRIGLGRAECRNRIFYSPHAFPFLRQDMSKIGRRIFLESERHGARVGSLILTSESEFQVARLNLLGARCSLVPNAINTAALPRVTCLRPERPIVAMAGRITYQKAPWAFAKIALELNHLADFVWLGDGRPEDKEKWLSDAPVEISGWMSLDALRLRLAQTDVLLFPTLWEGGALALIEAQAIGVPAVATRIAGNRDTVVDGLSGYLCDTQEELLARTCELIVNADIRARMSEYALTIVRSKFDDRDVGKRLLEIYQQANGIPAAERLRVPWWKLRDFGRREVLN